MVVTENGWVVVVSLHLESLLFFLVLENVSIIIRLVGIKIMIPSKSTFVNML